MWLVIIRKIDMYLYGSFVVAGLAHNQLEAALWCSARLVA